MSLLLNVEWEVKSKGSQAVTDRMDPIYGATVGQGGIYTVNWGQRHLSVADMGTDNSHPYLLPRRSGEGKYNSGVFDAMWSRQSKIIHIQFFLTKFAISPDHWSGRLGVFKYRLVGVVYT
jgi:hypothetical protein